MRHSAEEPVYYISVAAKLIEVHPQTLRMYERVGLISPKRTPQGLRLYSERDIEKLRQIQRLTHDLGVNLAGVEIILKLLDQIAELKAEVERLRHDLEHGPRRLPAGSPEPVRLQVEVKE
ncbi:MAG: helix-turn-helix transcriptional regulator [Armatimonadetes bacterium]|nr:helix-turn-helix transcriptional regulator [Armatimonadota bacterium]